MGLSHFDITAAHPKERPFKLADGDGLHLLVQPNGNKFWRFRYQFGGLEKMMSLGSYPATSLAKARVKRNEARNLPESALAVLSGRCLDRRIPNTSTLSSVVAAWHQRRNTHNAKPTGTRYECRCTCKAEKPVSSILEDSGS